VLCAGLIGGKKMKVILTNEEEKAVYDIMNNQYTKKKVGNQIIKVPMSFHEAYEIYKANNLIQYLS
jgi:hypothetical protein